MALQSLMSTHRNVDDGRGAAGGAGGSGGPSGSGGDAEHGIQVFMADYDDEGVWFYQAFKDEIADWAIEHQKLGGPAFKPLRMTWIKPSFAWVLYRSGYGRKPNQTRVLKLKLAHESVAALLSQCQCKKGGGGSKGRVQWDPARDLLAPDDDGKVPRKLLRERAIQIGLKGSLSAEYVDSIIAVEDVTELAHRVGEAHSHKAGTPASVEALKSLAPDLPNERPYMPHCEPEVLKRLALAPGEAADFVARIGLGKAWT